MAIQTETILDLLLLKPDDTCPILPEHLKRYLLELSRQVTSKDFSTNLGLEADPILLLVIARHSRIVKIQAVLLEVKDKVGTEKVKTVKRILEQILR